MWLVYTWRDHQTLHDSFVRDMTQLHVTWLIHIWHGSHTGNVTHVYAHQGANTPTRRMCKILFYFTRRIHIWHDWHDSLICDTTHSFVICVRDTTHQYVAFLVHMHTRPHNTLIRRMCKISYCVNWLTHTWRASRTCNVTRLYNVTHLYAHIRAPNTSTRRICKISSAIYSWLFHIWHDSCMCSVTHCYARWSKETPPPGGFPIYYVPSSRTVCKRTPLEEPATNPSRGVLLHTVLDEET